MQSSVVTPRQFAEQMILAAEQDPGCERKAMLFYVADTGEFLEFVRIRSEARCMVIELQKDSAGLASARPERSEDARGSDK